jgi:hypothetical protein
MKGDDDLIRRGDALNVLRPYGSLIDVIDRIAALPAVTPQPAPDVAALVDALRTLVALNENYSPFGGEIYQDRVNRAWENARAALAAWEDRG